MTKWSIDSNQISNLLIVIVGEVYCKYVLSVLRDKLLSDIYNFYFEVLTLCQTDKLFKVRNLPKFV